MMTQPSSIPLVNDRPHIGWVDYLRIAACFLVVIAHCCDPYVGQEQTAGVAWGSLVRCCVPLFVMISGVLLLPSNMDMATFYKKRMKRILIPLVFWSLVSPWFYYLYVEYGDAVNSTNGMIKEGLATGQYTLEGTLSKMYLWLINFNNDTIPLWYVYMLVGLYLFMPILGTWVSQASKKEFKIFISLWLVSMLLPYVKMFAPMVGYMGNYGSMGILGDCFWNPYGTFYYFSGFIGYLVLAHYLVKYPLNWSWTRTLATSAIMFAVGYTLTLLGFLEVQKHFSGQYEMLEAPWYFCGINVFMMTYAVFIIFQKIKATPSSLTKKVAALTFGIFLCHFFFVQVVYDFSDKYMGTVSPWVLIPVNAVISFAISLLVTWVLSLTPITRKTVM